MISNPPTVGFLRTLLPCLVLIGANAPGQEPKNEPHGFVRLVNAVAVGTGKLDFTINGDTVRPEGYQLGNATGGIALKPGAHKMAFHREGVKDGATQVNVNADDTTILIPFAEQVPASDTEPAHWQIRILRLKQQSSDEKRTATFVSVSREPEVKVEIRQSDETWEAVAVKRLAVARAEIKQAKGYMPVRYKGEDLSAISVGPSGNYVSILYDDEKGVLRSKTFQDYKYLSAD